MLYTRTSRAPSNASGASVSPKSMSSAVESGGQESVGAQGRVAQRNYHWREEAGIGEARRLLAQGF